MAALEKKTCQIKSKIEMSYLKNYSPWLVLLSTTDSNFLEN
jgi:hypothetical protein